ncbi:hypothetical protein ES703_46073 [subsurface metagenome]
MDRKNWGNAVATGTFKKGRSEKKVLFEKVHKGRLTTTRTIRPASGCRTRRKLRDSDIQKDGIAAGVLRRDDNRAESAGLFRIAYCVYRESEKLKVKSAKPQCKIQI